MKKIKEKFNPDSHVELGSANNRYWFRDKNNRIREVCLLRDDYTSRGEKLFWVVNPKSLTRYLFSSGEVREKCVAKIFAKNISAIYRENTTLRKI